MLRRLINDNAQSNFSHVIYLWIKNIQSVVFGPCEIVVMKIAAKNPSPFNVQSP